MTRRTVSMLVCLTFVLAVSLPVVAAEGVSGKWKMTSKSPARRARLRITLEQTGEKLVVTSTDREGNDVKSEGTVKGADITWTMKRTTPNGEFVIVYKGKIDGKTMSGTTDPDGRRRVEGREGRVGHTPGRQRQADLILTSACFHTASNRFSVALASSVFFWSCSARWRP